MSERAGYLYIFPIITFVAGGTFPYFFLEPYLRQTEWSNQVESIMYMSMFVIIASLFDSVGNRNSRLKAWGTDTVVGASLMLFIFSFLVIFSVNVFLLIPFSSFVLFVISLFVSFYACFLFFKLGRTKG